MNECRYDTNTARRMPAAHQAEAFSCCASSSRFHTAALSMDATVVASILLSALITLLAVLGAGIICAVQQEIVVLVLAGLLVVCAVLVSILANHVPKSRKTV